MKILVVVAMPNEMKSIKEWIKSAGLKTNLDVDFLCCWIWNYEAISSLEHYLTENNEATFIWNIWICGYWNPSNEIKVEPIQVSNVINIHTEKEYIVPPFLQIAPLKTCFSWENVVYEKPKFKKEIWVINDEMYFDMESWWIEFVASKYKFPRLILKIPFDFVWKETEDLKRVKSFKEMWVELQNLPYHDYLEKILSRINNQNL